MRGNTFAFFLCTLHIFSIFLLSSYAESEPVSKYTNLLHITTIPQKLENTVIPQQGKSITLQLLPLHEEAQRMQLSIQQEKPDFIIEALMFYPGKVSMPRLFTILHSAGSMQGISYYSNSKKKIRVLYEESWIINNLSEKKKLPDPVFSVLPAKASFLMWQKDATLGGITYAVTLQSGETWISSKAHNVSTVLYSFVPVIQEEHLIIRYLALQTDEGILFYAVMSVKPLLFPGINERYISSLQNRVSAVYSWLEHQLAQQ